jgi:anaerobic selenocysteine-containing dehydrogenase
MLRVGERGEGKFKRVSWDEALDHIAKKMVELKSKYGPTAILDQAYAGSSYVYCINRTKSKVCSPVFSACSAAVPTRGPCPVTEDDLLVQHDFRHHSGRQRG